jgi:hypothetical protein
MCGSVVWAAECRLPPCRRCIAGSRIFGGRGETADTKNHEILSQRRLDNPASWRSSPIQMEPSFSISKRVQKTSGLISFWDFQGEGPEHLAVGPGAYCLLSRGGDVPSIEADGAPFGRRAMSFGSGAWLEVPRASGPLLDIHGPHAAVSLVAWIRRARNPSNACEAVAGMWNEHGKRQYCLFLNLGIHDSSQQVGAHISSIGGATPGFRYCMDAAIGSTPVPYDEWQCVAITYDGAYARSYLNGWLDKRGERNPYRYLGGIFNGGAQGADFTVGAVARPDRVEMENGQPVETGHVQSNLFYGLLGGLAVFDRALDLSEIANLQ